MGSTILDKSLKRSWVVWIWFTTSLFRSLFSFKERHATSSIVESAQAESNWCNITIEPSARQGFLPVSPVILASATAGRIPDLDLAFHPTTISGSISSFLTRGRLVLHGSLAPIFPHELYHWGISRHANKIHKGVRSYLQLQSGNGGMTLIVSSHYLIDVRAHVHVDYSLAGPSSWTKPWKSTLCSTRQLLGQYAKNMRSLHLGLKSCDNQGSGLIWQ